MPLRVRTSQKGGDKVRRILREGGKGRQPKISVGFFSTAKYQDGTKVAEVAAIQEFGAPNAGIPERPFFRQSVVILEADLKNIVRNIVNPETMVLTKNDADIIGAYAQGVIQDRITELRDPPNSPKTIALKQSSNPLVDTGHLRQSVTWSVDT